MTDVTFLSPSRLATYADCPRKFEYDYVQDVSTPDETRLYLNQGLAYHETIETVCEETDAADDPELVRDRAMDVFAEKWNEHLEPDEYASRAHREYQRVENRSAIESFFDPDDGDGVDHARRSVATEKWLDCVHDGLGLRGKADNVLRTDDGLHVFDYKRSLRDVVSSNTATVLEDHLDGVDHAPKKVRNAFQMAAYVEGIRQSDLYEEGMTVRFSFYGLLNRTSFESAPGGYDVSARGYPREVTDVYDEHYDVIWTLLERAHDGITEEAHEPTSFALLNEEACPDCEFRDACPEFIAEEVRR